jgi:hypothetical protein
MQQTSPATLSVFGNFSVDDFRASGAEDALMYQPSGVKTSPAFPIPDRQAWVLGDPIAVAARKSRYPFPHALKCWSGS